MCVCALICVCVRASESGCQVMSVLLLLGCVSIVSVVLCVDVCMRVDICVCES